MDADALQTAAGLVDVALRELTYQDNDGVTQVMRSDAERAMALAQAIALVSIAESLDAMSRRD